MEQINSDTLKLLDNCHSGLKMGIENITHVMNYAKSSDLLATLSKYKEKHEHLLTHINDYLDSIQEEGKEPCPITRAMSYISSNIKIATHNTDKEIANIMHDGCNMGIKSICKYLNEYPKANNTVRGIAKDIIKIEEDFADTLKGHL